MCVALLKMLQCWEWDITAWYSLAYLELTWFFSPPPFIWEGDRLPKTYEVLYDQHKNYDTIHHVKLGVNRNKVMASTKRQRSSFQF